LERVRRPCRSTGATTQPLPTFGAIVEDRRALAAAVGLQVADLVSDRPVQVVSSGVPFLFVPIVSREAVDRAAVDARALSACGPGVGEAFFFTTEGDETVYSRMLAPGFGIGEDPATGIASGPLGSYLVKYGLVTPDTARAMVSLQGAAMKRPSRVHISIEVRGSDITRVRVGGTSMLVGTGELLV
jgi:trans-2,3-dihydro-3-hydroxyanthranilate isomerase